MEVESGQSVSRSKSWNQYAIRSEHYCRFLVKHKGPLTSETNQFKTDTMKIRLEAAENIEFYFVYLAKGTNKIDSKSQAIAIPPGKTLSITRIEKG